MASQISADQTLLADGSDEVYYGLKLTSWLKVGIVAVLMAALFRFNLMRLWLKTNPVTGEANWQHSIFVPLIGLYYLYIHREELLKSKLEPVHVGDWTQYRMISSAGAIVAGLLIFLFGRFGPQLNYSSAIQNLGEATAAWGLLVLLLNWALGSMVFGIVFFVWGIWPGQNDYVKDLGMIVALFGLVLLLCGWRVMKIAWFPIVFLLCAIPWPGLVYSWVASPLQRLAAFFAVHTLTFVGVQAGLAGTKIFIDVGTPIPRVLNVAEACAGMRSLMTFISVAAAVAFLSSRPLWQKIMMTLLAIPIAIFCNVMRVSGQGLLDHFVSQELSQSFAHAFVGTIMLIPGFFMILLCGWFIDKIFVEEVDEESKQAAAAAAAAQSWSRTTDANERTIAIPRSRAVPAVGAPMVANVPPVAKAASVAPVAKVTPAAGATPAKTAIPAPPAASAPGAPAKAPVSIPIPPVSRPKTVMPPRPNLARGAVPPSAAPKPEDGAGGPKP